MQPTLRPEIHTAERSSVPYVAPFAIFFVLLVSAPYLSPVLGQWEFPLRSLLLAVTLFVFSRHVINFRVEFPLATVALGVGVFLIWIAPDVLIPGYRQHWLFQNSITGQISSSVDPSLRENPLVLATRSLRAIVLVPILEELFWRAWLLRWLINPNFWQVPLGAFTWSSMLISAALFGSEHGPFWEVGIAAGLIYNWWMVRTKSLGDLILAHAVTNACLSAYVIAFGKWEYWL